MNPKPRSFQRQAVPVTRSPVPSPILPRVGDRLGPRRGERPRGGDRERPRGGLRSRRGGERERLAMLRELEASFSAKLAEACTRRQDVARAREGAARQQWVVGVLLPARDVGAYPWRRACTLPNCEP